MPTCLAHDNSHIISHGLLFSENHFLAVSCFVITASFSWVHSLTIQQSLYWCSRCSVTVLLLISPKLPISFNLFHTFSLPSFKVWGCLIDTYTPQTILKNRKKACTWFKTCAKHKVCLMTKVCNMYDTYVWEYSYRTVACNCVYRNNFLAVTLCLHGW